MYQKARWKNSSDYVDCISSSIKKCSDSDKIYFLAIFTVILNVEVWLVSCQPSDVNNRNHVARLFMWVYYMCIEGHYYSDISQWTDAQKLQWTILTV